MLKEHMCVCAHVMQMQVDSKEHNGITAQDGLPWAASRCGAKMCNIAGSCPAGFVTPTNCGA